MADAQMVFVDSALLATHCPDAERADLDAVVADGHPNWLKLGDCCHSCARGYLIYQDLGHPLAYATGVR